MYFNKRTVRLLLFCTLTNKCTIWCMFVRASLYKRREENQLDATECFIALIICSTCFGHLYAHHQELETILVLLPHMVCDALVAGGWRSGAGKQAIRPRWGKLLEQFSSSRTHSVFSDIFFFENPAVYAIMWKNIVERVQATTWQYGACALHAGYPRLQTPTHNLGSESSPLCVR